MNEDPSKHRHGRRALRWGRSSRRVIGVPETLSWLRSRLWVAHIFGQWALTRGLRGEGQHLGPHVSHPLSVPSALLVRLAVRSGRSKDLGGDHRPRRHRRLRRAASSQQPTAAGPTEDRALLLVLSRRPCPDRSRLLAEARHTRDLAALAPTRIALPLVRYGCRRLEPFGAWRNALAPIANSGLTPPSSASQPTASIRHIHECPRRLLPATPGARWSGLGGLV